MIPEFFQIWEEEYDESITKADNKDRLWCALIDKEHNIIMENEKTWEYLHVTFEGLFACLSLMYEVEYVQKADCIQDDEDCVMLYFPVDVLHAFIQQRESMQVIKAKEEELLKLSSKS